MPETLEQRIERKAAAIRKALIKDGVVHTPDNPPLEWKDLPEDRKGKWRTIAATYCHVFAS